MTRSVFLAIKLAGLQLINNKKFAISFIANLAIGLIGFVLVDAFKGSIDAEIGRKSKAVLGADLAISARRMLSDEEIKLALDQLPAGTGFLEQLSLYSMAYNGEKSRLVNIVALDESYPLIPTLKLKRAGLVTGSKAKDSIAGGAWASQELLVQLATDVGNDIQVGKSTLRLTDEISEDPSASTSGFSLAPKLYISRQALETSGLIKFGSRLNHQALFLLPENANDVNTYAEKINAKLTTQDIRIRTHRTASQELNRALIIIGDNLSLVALIALFLAGIGASYLFKSHIQSQIKDMAILLTLGYTHKQLLLQAVAKIFLLSLLGSMLIIILSPLVLPWIPYAMKSFSKNAIDINLPFTTVWFSFVVAFLTSTLLCLPTLDVLKRVKPSLLLKETHEIELPVDWRRSAFLYLPSIFFFWALSCWQSRSLVVGSAFAAAFVLSALLMYVAARVLILWMNRKLKTASFPSKLTWLNLVQTPSSTIVSYLAISLCALLLNIIPHLEATVSNELRYPDNKMPPSLFLFDIQEDQVTELKNLVEKKGMELQNLSPLIRARLEKINGSPVERVNYQNEKTTREREWENRLRNRTYNLSYRPSLIDSETLIDGREFTGLYDWNQEELPEISLEKRFADRLGLEVGDTMEFDIQGVSVEGKIVNTRKVKWTSFQPNFFVQFQPGVLGEAPKSFLAAIGNINFNQKMATQNSIVNTFPNISIVDVEKALKRISGLINNILAAVSMITFLAILAGIAVIFSIMDHNAQLRLSDTNLYKMLGVGLRDLKFVTVREVALLIGFSCFTGLAISIVVTTFITYFILNEMPVFNWRYSLQATAAMLALGFVTGYGTVARSLAKKPRV